jgi:hypothetical protein
MFSMSAAALALLAAAACLPVTRADAFQKATSLGQYEQQMWEQVKAGRWNDVHARIAESYRCTMPNGAHSRAEMMDFLRSMKLQGFKISNLQSSPNGADMVVTSTSSCRGRRPASRSRRDGSTC